MVIISASKVVLEVSSSLSFELLFLWTNNIRPKYSCGIIVNPNKCISHYIGRREGLLCANYGLQIIYIYIYICVCMYLSIDSSSRYRYPYISPYICLDFPGSVFQWHFSSHTIKENNLINCQIKWERRMRNLSQSTDNHWRKNRLNSSVGIKGSPSPQ